MQGGWTALGYAVGLGYADVARLLLENGAIMDFEDEVSRTDMNLWTIYSCNNHLILYVALERISLLCK